MPCTISKIFTKVGQSVKKGENLIALEAMKMEYLIKSGRDGIIKHVYGVEGKFVDANAILIEFEE
jgi:3-methylcrotonyl-CoA carboxylase alpha subunit